MTLDTLITEAASSGRFVGLTLWKTSEGRWQAAACTSRTTCSVAHDDDPVAALRSVPGERPAVIALPAPPAHEGLFE